MVTMTQAVQAETIQTWTPKPGFKRLTALQVPRNQQGNTIRVRGPDGHERSMPRQMLEAFYQLADAQMPEAA